MLFFLKNEPLVIGSGAVELHRAEEEEEYIADIQHQADADPNWAKPERALDWSPKEVAFWLDSIELSQYARNFDEEDLDGNILLNDCDKAMLSQDMGIKNLHVGKILRWWFIMRFNPQNHFYVTFDWLPKRCYSIPKMHSHLHLVSKLVKC